MFKKREKEREAVIIDQKNHTAEAIEKVHGWSFAAFEVIVYIIIDRLLLNRFLPDSIWGEALRAVVFFGGYKLIYFVIKNIYEKTAAKKYFNFDISGNWYHVHIPNKLDEDEPLREYLSAGKTRIKRNLRDFTFKADNFRYTAKNGSVIQLTNEASTEWWTETSEICDDPDIQMVEVYHARSSGNGTTQLFNCPVCRKSFKTPVQVTEATTDRYGIHLYRIKSETKIVCSYSDCYPSLKSGKLYLYRYEEDRDNKIKEYFKKDDEQIVIL